MTEFAELNVDIIILFAVFEPILPPLNAENDLKSILQCSILDAKHLFTYDVYFSQEDIELLRYLYFQQPKRLG